MIRPDHQAAKPPRLSTPNHGASSNGRADKWKQPKIEQSIPERFESIVRLYPDRLAVKAGDHSLTYAELNRAANRIACSILAKRGMGSEPIALLFENGIDVIAAIFGTLKAGKAYVVLDPSFPVQRNAYILNDSQARLLVTHSRNIELACKLDRQPETFLTVDDFDASWPCDNPGLSASADNMAAITYTSGSTGNPKGVVHTHRVSLHGMMQYAREMLISPDDRLSLLHSASFGSARVHLLLALLNGATLFPFDVKRDGAHRLASWLRKEGITICHLPPALFRQLADSLSGQDSLPSLRLIRLTGAPITQLDFELYRERFPQGTLLQILMGSTEAGEIASAIVGPGFSFPQEGAPVGYARDGKKILLLNENGVEVGPNETGEIAVKSRYLRPGYWGRDDLTGTKFLPDPSGGEEPIYLTGDLGRMMPDGFLVHLGRKDLMIKITGYRIELTEIERRLLQHPEVREAAVVAWDREPGEKYLVAYIVVRQHGTPSINDLRRFLKEHLPDYMIPSAYFFLESLPLANGKLDRNALPKPDRKQPGHQELYAPAQSETERKLVQIWEEVLGKHPVGIHDDFFNLGGRSLQVAKLLTKIQDAFHLAMPLRWVLESPTVGSLAKKIADHQGIEAKESPIHEATLHVTAPAGHHGAPSSVPFTREECEQSIPDRFEKIVRAFPDRIAVKTATHVLTYAELNASANRLARAIEPRQGDKAEAIALLFENGPEQMAATLAVLKTGNFFALLDPLFPGARLEAVLEDCQAKLIITDRQHLSMAEELTSRCRGLIEFETVSSDVSAENLELSISPKALAYIGYTSGSTGEPKGVIRDHRAFLHHILLYTEAYHLCEHDRLSLLASGTGRAINDTFMALLNGGALLPFDVRREGVTRLPEWLSEEGISIWSVSSPLFRNVCQGLTEKKTVPALRLIRLGSEAAYKEDFDLYKAYFPRGCLLANGLTSHESGLLSTYLMDHHTDLLGSEVPVGYAVADKEILLLDNTGKEVACNQVGEIVVRSKYLSPGYWKRPDLTESKFKPDPNDPEKQLYFSGDLGLMLPDGCLIHKGRKDFRVKIRGYGVEMEEVEKTLRAHEAIREAVLVARQNEQGEANLIAYFTSAGNRGPTVGELRRFLKQKLPDYSIPSAFVMLDQLPLTSKGKVDRKAMPEPNPSRPELDTPLLEPRTFMEEKVAKIWAEGLGLERVGVHDDFFALGGHSLLGAKIIAELQNNLGIDLTLRMLFESPTVAKLAARLDALRRPASRGPRDAQSWSYLFELQSGAVRRPVFFFPGGGGGEPEFFIYAKLARHVGLEYPFYGLRARGADGVAQPHHRVEEMAADYLKELPALQPHGPYFLVGECFGGIVAFEAARQLQSNGQKVALMALLDTARPTKRTYLRYRLGTELQPLIESYLASRISFHWKQFRQLPAQERMAYLLGKLHQGLGSVPYWFKHQDSIRDQAKTIIETDATRQVFERILQTRETYRRTLRRHKPKPYPGKIHMIVNAEWHKRMPALGWARLALGGVEIRNVPGNHDTYIRDHVEVTAAKLREFLITAESMLK